MAQSFKWRTEVTEFFAVVLAVVVGLAADEWRQGFQDRALERTYLERLEADLVSGRERIAILPLYAGGRSELNILSNTEKRKIQC